MNKKCPYCRLVNFSGAETCARCDADLVETSSRRTPDRTSSSGLLVRIIICFVVCVGVLAGFYVSMIVSAERLTPDEKGTVLRAVSVLREKGFGDQTFVLEHLTVFRATDNWLNASVAKENAYAATNFPFEIMTLYPDFFTYPVDDTERAAILLHETQHLKGENEHDAYRYVWMHRQQLGWTKAAYGGSPIWQNVRKQTKENAPDLFICDHTDFSDCTE